MPPAADPAIARGRKPLNRRCQWCGERGYIFKLNQKFCTGRPDRHLCQREDYNERKRTGRKAVECCETCGQAIRNPKGRPRKDGSRKAR